MRFNLPQFIFLHSLIQNKTNFVSMKIANKGKTNRGQDELPLVLCFTSCSTSHSVKLFPMSCFLTLTEICENFPINLKPQISYS